MATARYESDSHSGTSLSITQNDNGDIICTIAGDGEFRISASGGKLTGVRLRNVQSLFAEIINELNKGVQVLTKEQLAEMLNGRVQGHELTPEECEVAKENGLVVVYGYSDDGMVFNGAISGQVDCWQGGVAYLDEKGLKDATTADGRSKTIRTVRSGKMERAFDGMPCWSYETDIPHVIFRVYEYGIDDGDVRDIDDDVWCEGIVFDVAEVFPLTCV